MERQEKSLKKILGRGDLFSMAVGQIIGAGVMSLCGVAIGMTGTGVVLAFVLAAVISCTSLLPAAQVAAACPTTGGTYRYPSRLLGAKAGFFEVMVYILCQITVSMYAITFATYFQDLVPGINLKLVALSILTIIFVTNILGTKNAAIVQKILVIALIAGLGSFILFGLVEVNYNYVFNPDNLFPNGPRAFLTASALLTFSTSGAITIAELGGEAKNPAKDLPIAMIGSTLFVGVLYALISLVASGVLPWEEVADQPLSLVAAEILPRPFFYVFLIGGALGATATTLNATFSWVTKPVMIACEDGWFPKRLANVNHKFGTPHYLILIFYVVGVVPIVLDISLNTIATIGSGLGCVYQAMAPLSAVFLIKKYPQAYQNSKFKLSPKMIPVFAVFAFTLLVVQAILLISDLTALAAAFSLLYLIFSVILAFVLERKRNIKIPADLDENINSRKMNESKNGGMQDDRN